jgi:hypothetical protein
MRTLHGVARPAAGLRARATATAQRRPARLDLAAIVDSVLGDVLDSNDPQVRAESAAQAAEADQRFWTEGEGLDSELRFHNKLGIVAAEIHSAYSQNQLEGLRSSIRRLAWAGNYIGREVLVSVYESCLVSASLYVALSLSDRFLVEPAYRICECVKAVLVEKQARRAAQGMPERPDSECWLRMFVCLAELKWKSGADQLDRVLSPDVIIEGYYSRSSQILTNLLQIPSQRPDRDKLVADLVGWCGLQIIKMALMWQPERTAQLVAHFSKLHGPILHTEPGHFLHCRAPRDHPEWFWDYELFKWCIAGPASYDEAVMCYQWRLDSVRAGRADEASNSSYNLAAQRELEFLLQRGQQLEVASV